MKENLSKEDSLKVLFVDACMRGRQSRTIEVAEFLLELFCKKYRKEGVNVSVDRVNLSDGSFKPMDGETVALRDSLTKKGDYDHRMFDGAKQLASSDILMIAAPCWDLSFPAMLKVYIENMVVYGLTFTTEGNWFKGLCNVRQTFYVSTAGGDISRQPWGVNYIKEIAGMLGLGQVTSYMAGCMDIYGENPDNIIQTLKDEISSDFE
ncbi:MAG: NAD(P)H-dependent oxidoreductase [Clostridiales bacterium]|nr:NAD(P)H-dependent oxidoreductase [Clostridiales bacterium]MDY4060550.1 NAD(P)H-dependent oxidoreductase [Anaerovoracaceae bacterium]